MKKLILIIASLAMGETTINAQELNNPVDSISYSAGVVVAQNLKKQGFKNLSSEIMAQAVYDVLNDKKLNISEAEADDIFKQEVQKLNMSIKEENKLKGEAFLVENAKKEGITTLESGLQYEVMTEGDGPMPAATDEVETHYHGTLIDGTVFDSSVDRGETLSFPLNRVIKAWQEALPLMKVGSKWRIFAPYYLAYGDRPAGPLIKPYSALIFEIELISIK